MLSSFIEVEENSDFPIQNLPYGIFREASDKPFRVGVAIGSLVLDLSLLEEVGLISANQAIKVFNTSALNQFADLGPSSWSEVRTSLTNLLDENTPTLRDNNELRSKCFFHQSDVEMKLPFDIGGFTDYYSSENHAANIGRLFRNKDNPLLPNWKHIPVAYNGRASTVFSSGTPVKRPAGQIKLPTQEVPVFSESKRLDFELELGFFVAPGNSDGKRISVKNASSHIFGAVLLNDWSARDIQAWEYVPLGPFLGKSFATSISPWVVPMEALEPFMIDCQEQNPKPVSYLQQENRKVPLVNFEVAICPEESKKESIVCKTTYQEIYWSMEQQLSHHTINNCIMKTGDLLASGTISGSKLGSWGSLLESSFGGKNPIKLEDGSSRTFLEDGDNVIMRGYCKNKELRIGFGSVEGVVTPSDHL